MGTLWPDRLEVYLVCTLLQNKEQQAIKMKCRPRI